MYWGDVFFFQAEDGIRDIGVTGVQTCALPISDTEANRLACEEPTSRTVEVEQFCSWSACRTKSMSSALTKSGSTSYGSAGKPKGIRRKLSNRAHELRSEKRRVGEECRSRGAPYHYKKQTLTD